MILNNYAYILHINLNKFDEIVLIDFTCNSGETYKHEYPHFKTEIDGDIVERCVHINFINHIKNATLNYTCTRFISISVLPEWQTSVNYVETRALTKANLRLKRQITLKDSIR